MAARQFFVNETKPFSPCSLKSKQPFLRKTAVLRELMRRYAYQLKFVVERPQDLDEIRALIEQLDAPRERVILMPEGIDAERLHERSVWLAEICKEEGLRFSPRLQVDLWGNQRGV